jgi:hypothetical protein
MDPEIVQLYEFVLKRSAWRVHFGTAMAHALQEHRPVVLPAVRTARLRVAVGLAGDAFVGALRRSRQRAARISVTAVSARWLRQHTLGVSKRGERW